MKIFRKESELKKHFEECMLLPRGFVPTMGALHKGHLSLVEAAINECRLVIVSIFVNPTQFNDKKDLDRYPRTVDEDLKMLSTSLRANDAVFIPEVDEVYPEPDTRVFDFGSIDKAMEGLHRPGHFNGVAQVVSRLFEMVSPDIAYFGQKDFQQLAVIREMVRQTGSKVRITACPIVREDDGLAMSSRNMLLLPQHRMAAGIIYKSLNLSVPVLKSGGTGAAREFFRNSVEANNGFIMEYYEVVDDVYLIPVAGLQNIIKGVNYFICVAIYAGGIRLIDNIHISLE